MIQALVIAMLIAVFTAEYLVRARGLLHPYMVLLPELLSAIAMVVVLVRMTAGARIALDSRYVLFLGVLAVVMVSGFLLQDVPPGAAVAGIRSHLKFVPFFLLPAVYRFTPEQLGTQLKVLICILLLQTPLADNQRFVEFSHMMATGDPVRGTATTSSALSLLMLCGIAALVALYLRRKIRFRTALVLIAILFLPTTINETKATLLLLPVAVLVPALYMPRGSRALRRILPIVAIGALAGVAFVGVYDTMVQNRENGPSLGTFFGEGRFERYLYSGGPQEGANYIGRLDSVEIAAEHLARDPLTLAIGMGAGNVNTSFMRAFDGKYAFYYERFGVGMTQVTMFLWEIGIVGLAAYLFLYWCVYRDARLLARNEDSTAVLGQIWVAVTVIMAFALMYKSVFSMNEIGYLFWYFSGIAASEAVLQRRERRARFTRAPALFASPADAPQRAAAYGPLGGGHALRPPAGPLGSPRSAS
jgi:hypothetical protein